MKLIIIQFPHPHVTFSALGENILSALFLRVFNLCSSLRVRDQVSHPIN